MPDWMSLLLLLAYGLTCLVAGAIVANVHWVIREVPREPQGALVIDTKGLPDGYVPPSASLTIVAGVPVWDLDDECDPETLDSVEIL